MNSFQLSAELATGATVFVRKCASGDYVVVFRRKLELRELREKGRREKGRKPRRTRLVTGFALSPEAASTLYVMLEEAFELKRA